MVLAIAVVLIVLSGAFAFVPEFQAAVIGVLPESDASPDIRSASPTAAAGPSTARLEPTPTVAPTDPSTPTPPPAVVEINLGFAGDFSAYIAKAEQYGPGNGCEYIAQADGTDLVTFITLTTVVASGGTPIQITFGDDDGDGPANPHAIVSVNGVRYQWDRDSNLRFEGTTGGTVTYFSGGLGVDFDLDLHRFQQDATRVRMIGTVECPPDPFASLTN